MVKKILLIFLISFICVNAYAEFGVDTYGYNVTGYGSSTTFSLTVADNTDRLILAYGYRLYGNNQMSSITYNGTSFTHITGTKLWYLLAPETGTHDVVCSCSASETVVCYATSVYGLKQQAPEANVVGSSATRYYSVDITTITNNAIVIDAVFSGGSGLLSIGSNQTLIFSNTSVRGKGFSYRAVETAGTITNTWEQNYDTSGSIQASSWEIAGAGASHRIPTMTELRNVTFRGVTIR